MRSGWCVRPPIYADACQEFSATSSLTCAVLSQEGCFSDNSALTGWGQAGQQDLPRALVHFNIGSRLRLQRLHGGRHVLQEARAAGPLRKLRGTCRPRQRTAFQVSNMQLMFSWPGTASLKAGVRKCTKTIALRFGLRLMGHPETLIGTSQLPIDGTNPRTQ